MVTRVRITCRLYTYHIWNVDELSVSSTKSQDSSIRINIRFIGIVRYVPSIEIETFVFRKYSDSVQGIERKHEFPSDGTARFVKWHRVTLDTHPGHQIRDRSWPMKNDGATKVRRAAINCGVPRTSVVRATGSATGPRISCGSGPHRSISCRTKPTQSQPTDGNTACGRKWEN